MTDFILAINIILSSCCAPVTDVTHGPVGNQTIKLTLTTVSYDMEHHGGAKAKLFTPPGHLKKAPGIRLTF